MEHDDRPPVATFFCGGQLTAGSVATLSDAQAHHARVKRLDVGDAVRLTDGVGHTAVGSISALNKSTMQIDVTRVDSVPRPAPIHLRVPIGDRERMLWLAEKATELGISSWQAVRFRRSASVSPRGEGPAFAEKVRARMIGALEQSGGAWLPEILPDASPEGVSFAVSDTAIPLDAAGDTPTPVGRLPSAAFSARPNSAMSVQRSSGFLARARQTVTSIQAGRSGCSDDGRGTGAFRWPFSTTSGSATG